MQNTFSQSGNDSKWFLKKSFFKIGKWHSRPPRDPPPFMANAILNFHFDYLTPSLSCTELAFSHARITSFKPQQRQWVCEWKSDRWGKVLMEHGFGENKGPLAIFKEDLTILRAPNSAQYCPNLLLQWEILLWIYWMCVSQRPQLSQLLWNNSAYHQIPIWQDFS